MIKKMVLFLTAISFVLVLVLPVQAKDPILGTFKPKNTLVELDPSTISLPLTSLAAGLFFAIFC